MAQLIYRDDYFGFVYIWYDTKRKMYYVGSHVGSTDDGYVCSSKRMKRSFKKRPDTFKRRIIFYLREDDRSALIREEHRWLSMMRPEEMNKKYYNVRRNAVGWKTAEALKEMLKTKRWTPERRAAHSQKMREKWKEPGFRDSMDFSERAASGWKNLDETARKERASRRKWEVSDETRRRMSEAAARRASDPEYKKKFVDRTSGTRTRNDGRSY